VQKIGSHVFPRIAENDERRREDAAFFNEAVRDYTATEATEILNLTIDDDLTYQADTDTER